MTTTQPITAGECVCEICDPRCLNRSIAGRDLCGPCEGGMHADPAAWEQAA